MFKKRLIAFAVSIYTLGVVFGMFAFSNTFSHCAILSILIVLSVIFLAVSARPNGFVVPKYVTAIAIAVAVFSFGILYVSLGKTSFQKYASFDGEQSEVVLDIVEVSSDSLDGRVVSCSKGVTKGTTIRFYPDNIKEYEFIVGDEIFANLRYDYKEKYNLYSQGIKLTAYGKIISKNVGGGIFYYIRSSVHENCDNLFGGFESAGAISKGITIGDRSDIDSYLFSLYRSSGLSHVLAISGFHISIISMTLFNFLNRIGIKRKISTVITILIATIYCALVGFDAGAVRSVIMLSFVLVSNQFLRRADNFTTLFIALFVLLVINPFSIYSAGFQLSFLCCLGILLVQPVVDYLSITLTNHYTKQRKRLFVLRGILDNIIEPMVISVAAAVFSFPVICTRFDSISCASPIVNVIAVPLFTVATIFSIIAYIFAPISIAIARIIAFPAGVLFDLVTDISRFIYDFDVGIISTHTFLIIIPLVLSLAMIASLVFLGKKRFVGFLVCLCLFCVSLAGCYIYNFNFHKDTNIVEYGEDGKVYVYTTSQGGAYIDLGGYNSSPETVFENGETSLGHYVIIGYSEEAYERVEYFSGTLKIDKIHVPIPVDENDVFLLSRLKELAKRRNCDIILYEEYFSDVCPVSVYGLNENTLVCVDVGGQKIRILGSGFKNAVNCDIAIVTKGYLGEESLINSGMTYVSKEYAEDSLYKYYGVFDDRIRIEIDTEESDCRIYEP